VDGQNLGTFPVGNQPEGGIAFDGANMWVSGFADDSLTKLRASDGQVLGTFGTNSHPTGVCFDGQSIWVAMTGRILEYRTSDGQVLNAFAFATLDPQAVAFDGTYIWLAGADSFGDGAIAKMRRADGAITQLVPGAGSGIPATGLAVDGTNIWAAYVAPTLGGRIGKWQRSNLNLIDDFDVGGASPKGVAFDGANMWVTNEDSGTVSKR
jgi:DNA-binding beta-propeller fold protein YncE